MGRKRYCAVLWCTSGRYYDKRARSLIGMKQASLFKVPARFDLRRIWCSVLHTALCEDDLVCERHFLKEDIVRFASGRFRLSKAAIPIDNRLNYQNNVTSVRLHQDSKNNQTTNLERNTFSAIEPQNSKNNQDGVEHVELPSFVNAAIEDDTQLDAQEIYRFLSTRIVKSIDAIVGYFSANPLPPSWSWHKENDKILFTQLNTRRREVRWLVECHSDLNVKIFTALNREVKSLSRKVSSIADLLDLIKEIEEIFVSEEEYKVLPAKRQLCIDEHCANVTLAGNTWKLARIA